MDTKKVADYQVLKINILHAEKEIEECFKLMEKKQIIDTNNPSDYGANGFSLLMYFDEINIMALNDENITKLKQALIRYQKMRRQQSTLELELRAETLIMKQNIKSTQGIQQ